MVVLRHLQSLVPVGVAQVGMLAMPVIPVVQRRNATIARVLHRPVAGRAATIVVAQRRWAAGAPIGHAAMIVAPELDAMTKPAQRRTPNGRRG